MRTKILVLGILTTFSLFKLSLGMEKSAEIPEDNPLLIDLPVELKLYIFQVDPKELEGLDIFESIDAIKRILPLKTILLICKDFYSLKPALNKEIRRSLVQKFAFNYLGLNKDKLNELLRKSFEINENYSKEHEIDIAKLILVGADPNLIINTNSETGIFHHIAYKNNYTKLIPLLLLCGANINARSNSNTTPLIAACGNKAENIVKIFLENGAEVNAQASLGGTALIIASKFGLKSIVQLLLNWNADTNVKDLEKETALVFASTRGFIDIVELLLKFGADSKIPNYCGETAFSLTLRYRDREEIIKMLMAHDTSIDLDKINYWQSKYFREDLKKLQNS